MAHTDDETIDLRTLEDVQRLLSTTEFASADQLAGQADAGELARLADALGDRPTTGPDGAIVSGADPLPRRR